MVAFMYYIINLSGEMSDYPIASSTLDAADCRLL